MSLKKLLETTFTVKGEIEQAFSAPNQVQGFIEYESVTFTFTISPPIKPLALTLAQKYFHVRDGSIIIEGEGIAGLAQIQSDISKWIADIKEFLEAHTE